MQNKIFHYTHAQTLLNMVEREELWLTHYQSVNDSREFIIVQDLIKNAWQGLNLESLVYSKFNNTTNKDSIISSFHQAEEKFLSGYFGPMFSDPRGYVPFLISMSKKCDSLPQWRAYGNGEIAIHFDRLELQNGVKRLSQFPHCILRDVSYRSTSEDIPDIVEILTDMLGAFVSAALNGNVTSSFYLQTDGLHLEHKLAPMFQKHNAFKEEDECRLVA